MKFSVGDKVKLLKRVTINKNVVILSGALGIIKQVLDLSRHYGEDGKLYIVCWEQIVENQLNEIHLQLWLSASEVSSSDLLCAHPKVKQEDEYLCH